MHALHGLVLTTAMLLVGCSTAPPSPSKYPTAPARPAAPRLTVDQTSDIAIHAMGLVGTPYRYGGNTPESGFDCSGLVGYGYPNRGGPAPPRTVAQLDQWGQSIARESLRTGDLVVFGRGRTPHHAGIYVGEGRFVHAPSSGGTVRLDRLDGKYWSAQQVAFRRP